MSRKFLDDNVELELIRSVSGTSALVIGLPKQTSTAYNRGHFAIERVSGKRFTNEGNNHSSLFVNPDYNVLELTERLTALPHLTANQSASGNTSATLVGTNAADAGATFNTQGGVTLTTTTSSADQVILSANNTNSVWGSVSLIADNSVVFETQIVTAAAVTLEIIWAGLKLTNTSVVTTDSDQTMFRYAAATDGFWHIVTSVGNVDVDTATSVAVVASTAYLLQIRVGNDRKPHYYINGLFVGSGAALTAATALKPFVGVQTATTAAKAITVRHVKLLLPRTPLN